MLETFDDSMRDQKITFRQMGTGTLHTSSKFCKLP